MEKDLERLGKDPEAEIHLQSHTATLKKEPN